jgi:hypothetical protein
VAGTLTDIRTGQFPNIRHHYRCANLLVWAMKIRIVVPVMTPSGLVDGYQRLEEDIAPIFGVEVNDAVQVVCCVHRRVDVYCPETRAQNLTFPPQTTYSSLKISAVW